MGSMLKDNIYFAFDRGDILHGQLWWFDEYDVDMGDPLGPYSEDPYGPGTFSRAFEKGLVVLNNSGQSIEVGLEEDHYDVSFRQEGTRFVIPAYDARILSRVSSQEE